MKILLIGTVNGKLDEGMRNIATHLCGELSETHDVISVQLKDFAGIINNLFQCDYVLICARADKKLYALSSLLCKIKPVGIVLVQPVSSAYRKLCSFRSLPVKYFTLSLDDVMQIPNVKEDQIKQIPVGIDSEKFCPINENDRRKQKQELGLDVNKPVILHVGHCSKGRRIEKLALLPKSDYERIVITSGMFVDKDIEQNLIENGVKIISGYIPSIEKYYQAADVYLFPTIDTNYVISIPLSVMEALSCGTPVVAYRELLGLMEIKTTQENAILLIDESDSLNTAIREQLSMKSEKTYLVAASWKECAEIVEGSMCRKL